MFSFSGVSNFKRVIRRFISIRLMDEVLIIFLLGITLFLGFSLFSYDNTDNSFLHFSNEKNVVFNFCGRLGANVSAFLFYYLGVSSFLILLFPLLFIILKFNHIEAKREYLRFLGLFILTLAAAGTLEYLNLKFFELHKGGLIGFRLYKFISFYFNPSGSILIFSLLFILSVILVCRVSIIILLHDLVSLSSLISVSVLSVFSIDLKGFYISPISFEDAYENDSYELLSNLTFCEPEEFLSYLSNYFIFIVHCDEVNSLKITPAFEDKAAPEYVVSNKYDSHVEAAGLLDSELKLLVLKFSKFKVSSIKSQPRYVHFSKLAIRLLPNSVISKNIFNFIKICYSHLFNDLGSNKDLQVIPELPLNKVESKIEYTLPNITMFATQRTNSKNNELLEKECKEQAHKLEEKLFHFGVNGKVTAIRPGPVITLFEYAPDINTKISKITSLEDDLALALEAMSIRILAPIPGRSVVGFEISNHNRETVSLSDILMSSNFKNNNANLPIVLGVDIVGAPLIEDLVSLPHLLIAGSTGSGKSVGLNSMLVSLLCKLKPSELKLILVDPKRLEFASYTDIPHLIFPIITDARKVSLVLKWVVSEMDRRYSVMANHGVRNLFDYTTLYKSISSQKDMEFMPWMVIIIDELADVMMVAGKEVEFYITRIAQMARAAGIHMIVATQRPSVDVVTGIIKVNFPSRIGYRVSSKIDSKTILDGSGAEKLLGRGDLLYLNPKASQLERIHGPYISDKEIKMFADSLRAQQKAQYLDIHELTNTNNGMNDSERDELYSEVVNYVKTIDEISISMLQRRYRIGFNRSARLIEQLERDGLLAPAQGSKPRKVLRMQ